MIALVIIVDGVVHGQRKWLHVPRIDDFIEVGSTNPQKPKLVRVVQVVWRKNEIVDIVCEEVIQ